MTKETEQNVVLDPSGGSQELVTVPLNTSLEVYTPPANFEVVDRGAAETVHFENIGDSFTGIYQYTTTVPVLDKKTGEIEQVAQSIFIGLDDNSYCIFPNQSLLRGLTQQNRGDWLRVTYDHDVKITGQPSPMKSYVIERGLV